MTFETEKEGGIVFLSDSGCYSQMGRKNKDALDLTDENNDVIGTLEYDNRIPDTWQYISGLLCFLLNLRVHWGVYKMGQKKFDTNVNKRREISDKNSSFQIKNTGDV